LIVFVALGTFALSLPPMTRGESLAANDALFMAVSALSLTGLSVVTPGVDLSLAGQVMLLILIQLGAVGYVTLAVLVFRLLGRSVSLTDRTALLDALGLVSPQGISSLAQRVFATIVGVEAIGALLLYLHWSRFIDDPKLPFLAVFHSIASFCNAGFELFTGDIAYPNGMPNDGVTLLISAALILMGGIGLPVLHELLTLRRRRLSLHSRLTLAITGFLVAFGGLGILVSESRPGMTLDGLTWWRKLELAFFQSISCRTAGFVGMPSLESLDPASQLQIVTLMFVGSAPASMGGGVTTGTLVVLVLALFAYLRGQDTPIVGGRAIPGEMVRKAASVLTVSLFVVITASWLLMLTHDVSFELAIFEAVSAFATCGLTLGFTTELNPLGQCLIVLMMIWGRLGALTLLVVLTRGRVRRRVAYPEEKILIG
jgi:trk system potassium uptake protein TrkH